MSKNTTGGTGGAKNTQHLVSITIAKFIDTIFQGHESPENVCLARKGNGGWFQVRPDHPALLEPGPWYFCIATVGNQPGERLKRRGKDAILLYCLVCDDIGTKCKIPPVEPSWIIETSPGNFQYGYLLEPTDDFELFLRTTHALSLAGYTDPGTLDITRVMRVPGSLNDKYDPPFEARLVRWEPDTCWSLAGLAVEFGVDPAAVPPPKRRQPLSALSAGVVVEDSVVRWLLAKKLVLADKGDWLDVICPWHNDHSDDRQEAGYSPLGRGDLSTARAFRCHHSHPHGTHEFLTWVAEQGGPVVEATDTAAYWRAGIPPAMAALMPTIEQHQEREAREEQIRREQARAEARAQQEKREEARQQAKQEGEGPEVPRTADVLTVEEMRERLVFIQNGSYVMDRKYPRHILRLSDARGTFADSVTIPARPVGSVGRPPKPILNIDIWYKGTKEQAYTVAFDPGAGEFCLDPDGKSAFNTWAGFLRTPGPEAPVEVILAHIEYLFGDRTEEFLDWLAHIEQHPGQLPHTAWLHISDEQGTGRNLAASLFARVFAGSTALCVDLPRMLDSGFNGQLEHKVLAVVDEIREGGPDRWRHTEKLRRLVNEEVRTINRKFGLISQERNFCRWLVFSNSRQALPIDKEDRRFEVVICDRAPHERAYYDQLAVLVADKSVVRGFARFLRERDLSGFRHGAHSKHTVARQQVIQGSRSAAEDGLEDFLEANADRELFLAHEVQRAAGLVMHGDTASRFHAVVAQAGLVKLIRSVVQGKQTVIYVRREAYSYWHPRRFEAKDTPFPKGVIGAMGGF